MSLLRSFCILHKHTPVLADASVIIREGLLEEAALPLGFPGRKRESGDPRWAWRRAQDNTAAVASPSGPPSSPEPGCQ